MSLKPISGRNARVTAIIPVGFGGSIFGPNAL
jgi:hypothetical protein